MASTAYGRKALQSAMHVVTTAQQGSRNGTLNSESFRLGGLVAGGELDETEAVDGLRAAALECELPEAEIAATIASGMRDGKMEPRTAPDRETPAKKKAWADLTAKNKAETEAKHSEAAKEAKAILAKLDDATDENGYLKRKRVHAVPGLKQKADGTLVVPVLDEFGNTVSLQEIWEDGKKKFFPRGRIDGCKFHLPGNTNGPLHLTEGLATGLTVYEATNEETWVAFTAGNLLPVAKQARADYPQRIIRIAADNDCADKDGKPREKNIGRDKAVAAAEAIGGEVCLCPAVDGKATDFNDLHASCGLDAVREAMQKTLDIRYINRKSPQRPPLKAIDFSELEDMELKPQTYILEPVISRQSLGMLFAFRGVGKTYAALSMAYAVATGGTVFGKWKAPTPQKVLYIDGEMPAKMLQERLKAISKSSDKKHAPGFLQILSSGLIDGPMPNLATAEGQDAIAPLLDGVSLLVIDNLATLMRTGKSNDEDAWLPVQEWLLGLRRRGISVLLVHHSGKSGQQRGTGAKEDVLDTVIQLKHPSDYDRSQGARFEVHFSKARGLYGDDIAPFEAWLVTSDGASSWTTKPVSDTIYEKVGELLAAGLSMRDIAAELDIPLMRVCRLKKKLVSDGRSFPANKGGRPRPPMASGQVS